MDWKSLTSKSNLKLAWRRINTGRNLQYKRFYREAYLVYESAVEDLIKSLHRELVAKVWSPKHAVRIYLPKPSGLQRPLSLLDIESQIVLQAVANIFAIKLYKKRQKVELNTVFSNTLSKPKDSIFFVERWQVTYRAFQDRCIEAFNNGFRWSAHFDLAAYYDTISHDLLLANVFCREKDPFCYDTLRGWFQTWSADNISAMTAHGIPQGPIASDFLSEAFFLDIDLRMQKESSFCYLRYVDDIRLFGKTENEVRKAAILLEQECRHRGLIPQSTKFTVRELKSPDEAMGALPSIPPAEGTGVEDSFMTVSEARKLLSSSIDDRPQRVKDKARFRYVMFRSPEDAKVLKTVLRLLPRHPEHIDAFTVYFSNFRKRKSIVKATLAYLESGVPYSYVRGELWHIIARQAGVKELNDGLKMAREDAKERRRCVVLSWGVMHFLLRCEKEGLISNKRRLSTEHPISRSLLAPIFSDREFTANGYVVKLLKGDLIEQFAGARQLQIRNIELANLKIRPKHLSPSCNAALKALGITRRKYRGKDDWIRDLLKELYGCKTKSVWHQLLGSEYEHALQILIETKARFQGQYSEWLTLQDSLFDTIIRKLQDFLRFKGLSGHVKTVGSNGKLIKYGVIIQKNAPFDKAYPVITKLLRDIHDRRNRLPGSHPYDEKGGARNKWLSKKERDALVPKVKNVLNLIADEVETHK